MAKKKKDDEETPAAETSDGSIAVNDAWTGMLAVSLLALIIGAGFLAYDYSLYSDPPKVSNLASTPPGAAPAKLPPKVEPPNAEQPKAAPGKDAAEKKGP